jgi:hypothetical protein
MLMYANETNPFGADQLRASVRFPIRLPIRLKTDEGEVNGETENISASGLSFLVEGQLHENARIEFTIAMPSSVMGSQADVNVHCIGRVVRCEGSEPMKHAAAVIDEYYFVP